MKLYENIKERRVALNITQEELAKKLGYKSTSTIAKIEAGKSDIPQSKIVAFANALNTTPGALMGWEEPQPILNEKELQLIANFRKLNEDGKTAAIGVIRAYTLMDIYVKKEEPRVSSL